MTSATIQGIQVNNLLPCIYSSEKMFKTFRTPNQFFIDYWKNGFDKFGYPRELNLIIMPAIMKVDVLGGKQKFDYIE